MIFLNSVDLIGDTIGTLPAMMALSLTINDMLFVHSACPQVFKMIPKKYDNIVPISALERIDTRIIQVDLHGAFKIASENNLHMTQAYFEMFGLPRPETIPQPELEFKLEHSMPANMDYALAPFSRSLPDTERWPQEKWQELVDNNQNRKFVLYGNSNYDDPNFLKGLNLFPMFDHPLADVAFSLSNLKYGLISVVTGISHMAHAIGTKHILLHNQGAWGINPNALHIQSNPVSDITLDRVQELMALTE